MSDDEERQRVAALEAEVFRLRAALAQRQAPAEFSKREALLVEAERVAHMGSWVWNLHTEEIGWSDEFYRILGLDPLLVEPSSTGFFGAIHPDDVARVQGVAQGSLAEGQPAPVEFRIVRPDGDVRDVRMEAALVCNERGEPAHVVGTVLDVTERLRSAALLERTVAELNEAQRAAGLGSWCWYFAANKVEWSVGMYQLLGLSGHEQPSEKLFVSHVHSEDRAYLAAKKTEALGSQVAAPIEIRIVRADGSVRKALVQASAMHEPAGKQVGFFGVVQDITERKAVEAQLRQSQKMEAIGTLAGGVAHDFNNYLMVIAGHTELLASKLPEGHPDRASLDAISDAYERCAGLTQQLLTLSRRRRAELQPVDLSTLLSNVAPLLRSLLGETIELCLEIDQPAMIEADPAQVEQVLMNLAVNARDAMPKGGKVAVSVEHVFVEDGFGQARAAPPRGHFVRLSVKDEGHGMSDEVRARLFEPFFTTKGVGKGTGLGLATAYGILNEAGGAIEAESALEQGSTLHTYWRPSQGIPRPNEPGKPPISVTGRGRCVLLVEDVDELRELLRHQLEREGYCVLAAADGEQALQIMAGTRVDVVISDVVMPKMGGVELARHIHRQFPEVRCLLMTGYSADALPGLLDAGMSPERSMFARLLRKPFTARQLVQTVGELVTEPISRAS